MALREPLTQEQIAAACRFHQLLPQWHLSDAAFLLLHRSVPGFDEDACLLKAVTINALYGTQVYAIKRMAPHICSVMAQTQRETAGPELVEAISRLAAKEGEQERSRTSFAAKFCHFFVDPERFPIYDDAARKVLKLHLGRGYLSDKAKPYTVFCANLKRLRSEAGVTCTLRELDRYLWITGMYMKWLRERYKPKPQVNVELREVIESPSEAARAELFALLPHRLRLELAS